MRSLPWHKKHHHQYRNIAKIYATTITLYNGFLLILKLTSMQSTSDVLHRLLCAAVMRLCTTNWPTTPPFIHLNTREFQRWLGLLCFLIEFIFIIHLRYFLYKLFISKCTFNLNTDSSVYSLMDCRWSHLPYFLLYAYNICNIAKFSFILFGMQNFYFIWFPLNLDTKWTPFNTSSPSDHPPSNQSSQSDE